MCSAKKKSNKKGKYEKKERTFFWLHASFSRSAQQTLHRSNEATENTVMFFVPVRTVCCVVAVKTYRQIGSELSKKIAGI